MTVSLQTGGIAPFLKALVIALTVAIASPLPFALAALISAATAPAIALADDGDDSDDGGGGGLAGPQGDRDGEVFKRPRGSLANPFRNLARKFFKRGRSPARRE